MGQPAPAPSATGRRSGPPGTGILLAVGVATRQRWARLAALGLFTATVVKMLVVDLWTLSTGERVLAFIGVGCLLLACSRSSVPD